MCIPAIGNCKSTQQFTSLLISVAAATLCRSTPIGSVVWLFTRLRQT